MSCCQEWRESPAATDCVRTMRTGTNLSNLSGKRFPLLLGDQRSIWRGVPVQFYGRRSPRMNIRPNRLPENDFAIRPLPCKDM